MQTQKPGRNERPVRQARTMTLQIVLMVIAVAVIGAVVSERQFRSRYNGKFPAISDDEFVRRCGAGTSREVALKVRAIVAEQTGIKPEHIHPETRFFDDLGMD